MLDASRFIEFLKGLPYKTTSFKQGYSALALGNKQNF